jgi:ABC-2 type transport system permease protein
MSLRRIGILLGREMKHGAGGFLIIFVIGIPLAITLVINLAFGTFFSGKPKLGFTDADSSQLVSLARGVDSIVVREYPSDEALQQAVLEGAVDFGMTLPVGFDDSLAAGEPTRLVAYIWGESLMKDRLTLQSMVYVLLRQMVGQEPPVEIVTATVGEGENIPWEDRLLPFVVLLGVVLSGVMVPATSLVNERQKGTFTALVTTSATVGEVLAAKGLLGMLLSAVMGVLVLVINRAFGASPLLLVGLLMLGGAMAAIIGLLLGVYVKDVNSLFATIKSLGILLYAPAIVYLFPTIPQWIGRFFPTYYLVAPIVEITQRGASWPDVALDVYILMALIVVMAVAVAMLVRRRLQRAA